MTDIKYAELQARKICRDCNLDFLPIPVGDIIDRFDLTVAYDNFEQFAAMLLKTDKLLIVNQRCPYVQRRFHIAHEIGHFILGHEGCLFKSLLTINCNNIKKPLEEKCADAFASELLIPSTKLRRIGFKNKFDVQKLKQLFAVSEKAMAYKLFFLGLPYRNTQYTFKKFYQ